MHQGFRGRSSLGERAADFMHGHQIKADSQHGIRRHSPEINVQKNKASKKNLT